jgi:hypothetical protein
MFIELKNKANYKSFGDADLNDYSAIDFNSTNATLEVDINHQIHSITLGSTDLRSRFYRCFFEINNKKIMYHISNTEFIKAVKVTGMTRNGNVHGPFVFRKSGSKYTLKFKDGIPKPKPKISCSNLIRGQFYSHGGRKFVYIGRLKDKRHVFFNVWTKNHHDLISFIKQVTNYEISIVKNKLLTKEEPQCYPMISDDDIIKILKTKIGSMNCQTIVNIGFQ